METKRNGCHAGAAAFLTGAVMTSAVAMAGEAPPAGKVKVFIFAGQSNMVGKADAKELPAEYRKPLPNVRLYSNRAWREFAGPVRGKKSEDGIGPEISAARLLAAAFPGQELVIVKTAVGGTNLHTQWNPERTGSLYVRMIEDVKAATEGRESEIIAMFWSQGASDAKNEDTAKAYGKNLTAFIDRVRKDLGRPDLPFVFSQQMEDATEESRRGCPFLAEVSKGKAEVAKTVKCTAIVSTDGMKLLPDGVHYDTAGTIEFGKRLYAAWEKNFRQPAVEGGAEEKRKP